MVRLFIRNGVCGVEKYFRLIGTERKTKVFLFCYQRVSVTYQDLKQHFCDTMDESSMVKILSDFISQDILKKLVYNNSPNVNTTYHITQKAVDLYPALELTQRYCVEWQNMYNTETCEWVTYSKKLLGSRWNARIIWLLFVLRSVRFNEIKGSIEGISFKMLSQQLQYLESEEVVIREDFRENPPHVEYSLTRKGEDLYGILLKIASWDAKYNRGKEDTGGGRSEINLFI